jgi:predicted MFS family arabinose efflux permease
VSREPLYTRGFWHLCAVHFTGAMAAALYILFPLYVRALGGSEVTIGLYAGLATAAAVSIRWPVGRWLDAGHRWRVLWSASAVHLLSWLLLFPTSATGLALAIVVALHGLAGGTLFATYFTVANDAIPASRRAEGIAMFGVFGMLPNGLGPAVGEIALARGGYPAYFAVASGFALVSLVLITARSRLADAAGWARVPAASVPLAAVLRPVSALLVVTLLFGLSVNALFTFIAPFVHTGHEATASPFFLAYSITSVVVRVVGGRLPDRLGLGAVLLPCLATYAAALFALAWLAESPPLVAIGIACGVGHGYAFPILTAMVVARTPPAAYGMALSFYTAMFDLGGAVGAPLLGGIAHGLGYQAMFAATGGVMLVSVLVAARRVWGS